MEHRRYSQVAFGLNIVSIIEEKVKDYAKEHWSDDPCPPEFWVSLNNEDLSNQSIMISINHLGTKFTEKLFPRSNADYGYESIINQMINMYNKTM